ncbi:MAG: hypothetical protein ACXW1S_06560 [Acidimicrobiia bacterium]
MPLETIEIPDRPGNPGGQGVAIGLAALLTVPALALRLTGSHPVEWLAAWRMKRIAKERRYSGPLDLEVKLGRSNSIGIAFLVLATVYSLSLPLKRSITIVDALVLITIFVAYMVRVSRAPAGEPDLVGELIHGSREAGLRVGERT